MIPRKSDARILERQRSEEMQLMARVTILLENRYPEIYFHHHEKYT